MCATGDSAALLVDALLHTVPSARCSHRLAVATTCSVAALPGAQQSRRAEAQLQATVSTQTGLHCALRHVSRPLPTSHLASATCPACTAVEAQHAEEVLARQASVLSQQAGQALPESVPEGLLRAGRKSLNAYSAGAPPSLSHRRCVLL